MYRFKSVLICGIFSVMSAAAQQATTAAEVVDRAIDREKVLMGVLQTKTPVAETYIQDLVPDNDFGTVPAKDHYFVGKVDLSRGLNQTSYLPKKDDGSKVDLFTHFFTIQYLPRGFAAMMTIDATNFDRDHYDFQFLRREFLGDVRTVVFAVTPRQGTGIGRFEGNIWVEDKGYNIVRFNGTYNGSSSSHLFLHFDSWRVNAGPDLWLPFEAYSQESHLTDFMKIHTAHFKALTRFWGYGGPAERENSEFTNLTIESTDVKDDSAEEADPSPVESLRAWQRLSEDNILERLERAGLVAKAGSVDKVLDTVVNNIAVTNNLTLVPEVRARVLLTTPLESFTIGRTIIISRGLLDTLPDEASLAAILSHELAHIVLGHTTSTDFAFSDRLRFTDAQIVSRFKLACTPAEEDAASAKAVELLMNSPYKEKLGQAGLYLKALDRESTRLPSLIRPLFGDRLVEGHSIMRMSALMEKAPELQTTRVDQVAALPLGSRTRLNPWTDELEMLTMRPVPLAAASEKMPFEIAPVYLHLRYENPRSDQVAENKPVENGN
jgi:hypothetical protein